MTNQQKNWQEEYDKYRKEQEAAQQAANQQNNVQQTQAQMQANTAQEAQNTAVPTNTKASQPTQATQPTTAAQTGSGQVYNQKAANAGATAGTQYSSQWQSQLDDIMNQILNREKFSYDMNADAMYQQYADIYQNQANLGMQNAMGQAAALTGGYGSSYGQAVGQQAYAQQMQGLNEVGMDLYNQALQQYMAEGDALANQYNMIASREADAYNRYLDDRNFAYQQEMDALSQQNWQAEYDRAVANDKLAADQWNQSFEYQQSQDAQAQQNWQAEYDAYLVQQEKDNAYRDQAFQYQQSQDAQSQANWQAQFDASMAQQAADNAYRDKAFEYQQAQDAQNQANWQAEYDAAMEQQDKDNAYRDATLAEDQRQFDSLYGEGGYYSERAKEEQDRWEKEFGREGEQWEALYGEGGLYNPEKVEATTKYEGGGSLEGMDVPTELSGIPGLTTTNVNLFDSTGKLKPITLAQSVSGDDEKSGYVSWNIDGKEVKMQAGVNPYTGTKNDDIQYGTFGDGGYQPNNVASFYGGDVEKGKLTKTVYTTPVNGVEVPIYTTEVDGKWWVWDAANNRYEDITEEAEEPEKNETPNPPSTNPLLTLKGDEKLVMKN